MCVCVYKYITTSFQLCLRKMKAAIPISTRKSAAKKMKYYIILRILHDKTFESKIIYEQKIMRKKGKNYMHLVIYISLI